MRLGETTLLLIMLTLAGVAGNAPASVAFESALREADGIRSADRERFRQLLESLEVQRSSATPLQRERLDYLQAYSTAVYGDFATGLARARALHASTTDPDLKFRAASLAANLHATERNFGEALRYLDMTMPRRQEVRNRDIRHDGINTAATVYQLLGQPALSLKYASETLRDRPGPRARCNAQLMQAQSLFALGRHGELDALEDEISSCESIGEVFAAQLMRTELARKWAKEGRHGQSIDLLQENLEAVEATGYAWVIAEAHALLAEWKFAAGKLLEAQGHAEEAIARGKGIANSMPLVNAHRVMYQIAERRGDPVAALASYRSYAEADKAFINEARAREMVYQLARQDIASKGQQIALLNQQNEVLELQQEVAKQAQHSTRLVAFLLALLVALIATWAFKVKRMHLTLRHFAQTDALTGISNRHYFTEQARQLLQLSEKLAEPASLLMFDLDHFKAINDAYGHVTGDWALRQVAETCQRFCRRVDPLGRVGGEEFAILLQGCDLAAGVRLADDIRVHVSRIDSQPSGYVFLITASIGISATTVSGYDLDTLMSHADLMLYRAKNEGRNRVNAYLPDASRDRPEPAFTPGVAGHRSG